ncbi:GNAT family N-acetyltransferase [Planomicrobium sp. CPCC 101079]|uniref:GNAT family N-acetyltransferase n=1 Tax=Planomicrobium sp. CPCC 101079 TaxID=2599618 RepID=UPI0011B38AB3|nr:GNAT family N-acetyltransferase [Planomicrobium sp. CPCC 101079]TWT03623.1 GNAT family N-acetyltransferase [Planomicrobium sp. CPCC 101079]
MKEVYFDENFGRLHEAVEGGTCEVFEFRSPSGTIRHMYIKREIPAAIEGETYYDLVTPFAYGGPVILDCEEDGEWDLVYEFVQAFDAYCKENRIVCEQVRFHPVAENAVDFMGCYETDWVGDTYGTNLKAFSDPVREEFSLSCQNMIWSALEAGVEYRVTAKPESLEEFTEFYTKAVEGGEPGLGYFQECGNAFHEQLVLVKAVYKEQVIGMSLNFLSAGVLHTHLAVAHPGFAYLNPVHVMRFGLTLWGKDNGASMIHDGGWLVMNGGIHNVDSFKRQFSKHTRFKWCIGRRIWDEEMYGKLCKAMEMGSGADSFPAYRIKESDPCAS